MTDEDTEEQNWPNGADVKLITSLDGVNWGSKTTVFEVQTSWAGTLVLDDGHFLVMGDNGGCKSQLVNM